MSDDVQAPVPCGRFYYPMRRHCASSFLCPNCTELITLRRRVAELEATAARRLELLRPFVAAYNAWVAADTDTAIEITPDQARAAAAEVAAKGGDRG